MIYNISCTFLRKHVQIRGSCIKSGTGTRVFRVPESGGETSLRPRLSDPGLCPSVLTHSVEPGGAALKMRICSVSEVIQTHVRCKNLDPIQLFDAVLGSRTAMTPMPRLFILLQ